MPRTPQIIGKYESMIWKIIAQPMKSALDELVLLTAKTTRETSAILEYRVVSIHSYSHPAIAIDGE